MPAPAPLLRVSASALLLSLASCGGGGGSGGGGTTPPVVVEYTIGGTLTGLPSGTEVALRNNGGTQLRLTADGAFVFPDKVTAGSGYAVTVATQPVNGNCTVERGTGTANAAVTDVAVTCRSNPRIGGTVSGLRAGTQVTLLNNLDVTRPLVVSANASFTFSAPVAVGERYSVTVEIPPVGQACVVSNGSGAASADVTNVAITCAVPSDRYAYLVDYGANRLLSFRVDPDNGGLGSAGQAVTGARPISLAADPAGRNIYVANGNEDSVGVFPVDAATGAAQAGASTVAAGSSPSDIVLHPNGRYAYVVNQLGDSVTAYRVDATSGGLVAVGPATGTGRGPFRMTVGPSGRYAYVVNLTDATITTLAIDPASGALTRVGTDIPAGGSPGSIVVEPYGRYAYVPLRDVQGIAVFAVDGATGRLTAQGSRAPTGRAPYMVAV